MFSIDHDYPTPAILIVGLLPHRFYSFFEDITVEVIAQELDSHAINLVTDTKYNWFQSIVSTIYDLLPELVFSGKRALLLEIVSPKRVLLLSSSLPIPYLPLLILICRWFVFEWPDIPFQFAHGFDKTEAIAECVTWLWRSSAIGLNETTIQYSIICDMKWSHD